MPLGTFPTFVSTDFAWPHPEFRRPQERLPLRRRLVARVVAALAGVGAVGVSHGSAVEAFDQCADVREGAIGGVVPPNRVSP